MDEQIPPGLAEGIERVCSAVRPLPGAEHAVRQGVRRRRQRARTLVTVASAAAMLVVIGVVTGLAGTGHVPVDRLPTATGGPEVSESPTATPSEDSCVQTDILGWIRRTVGDDAPTYPLTPQNEELVDPTAHRLTRRFTDEPGFAEVVVGTEKRAVLLLWKAPVPASVQDLAGVDDAGVRIVVVPTRYDDLETRAAMSTVMHAIMDTEADHVSPYVRRCLDFSGLYAAVPGAVRDRGALTDRLSELAGMPVQVGVGDGVDMGVTSIESP